MWTLIRYTVGVAVAYVALVVFSEGWRQSEIGKRFPVDWVRLAFVAGIAVAILI
jgi:hypothetical protein